MALPPLGVPSARSRSQCCMESSKPIDQCGGIAQDLIGDQLAGWRYFIVGSTSAGTETSMPPAYSANQQVLSRTGLWGSNPPSHVCPAFSALLW